MTDRVNFLSLYDRDYIGHFDLPEGRDVTVTILKVTGAELTAVGGRKSKKPVILFEGKDKGFCCNKTNGRTIAGMYGPIISDWLGKRITLFVSTTRSPDGSGDVPCIRIRPVVPSPKVVQSEGAA